MPACLYQIDSQTKRNCTEFHFKNEVDREARTSWYHKARLRCGLRFGMSGWHTSESLVSITLPWLIT